MPTLTGHLMDSAGAQSFPLVIFCCAVANLCLYDASKL